MICRVLWRNGRGLFYWSDKAEELGLESRCVLVHLGQVLVGTGHEPRKSKERDPPALYPG